MTTKQKKVAKQTGVIPPHRILREVLRHYIEFRELVMGYGYVGTPADARKQVLEHSYWAEDEDGNRVKQTIELSFWDLHKGIKNLAPRKREALWHNVIEDKKQKDVAKLMGITTVSVGQYVEAACLQLAEEYFTPRETNNGD